MNPLLKCKQHLNSKILGLIKHHIKEKNSINAGALSKLLLYGCNENNSSINIKLPYKSLKALCPELSQEDYDNCLKVSCDNVIHSVDSSVSRDGDPVITFNIDHKQFAEDILLNRRFLDPEVEIKTKNIVMDYSSPNIAKPFHMGHLRSTIIGNFLANLHEYLGHKVTRLTYIGDWGTQFGVLQLGIHHMNLSNADLKRKPISHLLDAYVVGNRLVNEEEEAASEARKVFQLLETGGAPTLMQRWKLITAATVTELAKTYTRLGVKFDEYHWESNYNAKACAPIFEVMEVNNLLEEEDGKKVMVLDGGRVVPLLKSDGTTLYLSRDVAAALDRWVTYRFDHMLYVVDNSQHQHFVNLKNVLQKLDYDWVDSIEHIKFGRVQGMSTRKGQVVFLNDILDEAKIRMTEQQLRSSTTKDSSENVADVLGVTALMVNDLKQRRMRDYSFDWDLALQSEGDSGVKLQYTHSRLSSLELGCGVSLPDHCQPDLLPEPEAWALMLHIARFEEAIGKAYFKYEAYEIVNYLFKLCNITSQALKCLNVKNQPAAVAEQRLLLFHRARTTLHCGMTLLGLQPLAKM